MTDIDKCLENAVRVVMPWLRKGKSPPTLLAWQMAGKEISTSLTESMLQSTSSVWYALKTEKHGVALKRENGGSEAW